MSIIQIIPDIHNKWFEAEEIIDKCGADKVVFLGDYFDSFGDTIEITFETAEWLKDSMKKSNRTHLMGNHDLSYRSEPDRCSGFSESKLWAIIMAKVELSDLHNYCWVDDWLCTHAGLTRQFMSSLNHKNLFITEFLDDLEENYPYRLRQCSNFRGGADAHSGIYWCDYNEFEDIPNVKQIFGHTHGEVRQTDRHICIDTWLQYYGLYNTDTKEMKVIKVE